MNLDKYLDDIIYTESNTSPITETTTYYFNAPKELFFKSCEGVHAVDISIEFPIGIINPDKATVMVGLIFGDGWFEEFHTENWRTWDISGSDIEKIMQKVPVSVFAVNKNRGNALEITKVIFNDPATVVLWSDNTKTVVKCDKRDKFDPEVGLLMAIAKKFFGNESGWYSKFKGYSNCVENRKNNKCHTVLEYVKNKYPDRIRSSAFGGVAGCPFHYVSDTVAECGMKVVNANDTTCKICFDQLITENAYDMLTGNFIFKGVEEDGDN